MITGSLLKILKTVALLVASAMPLAAQLSRPCLPVDERLECAAPAKVDTIQADHPEVKPPARFTKRQVAPEVSLDFGAYVEQSIGHPLPLFGRDLFANAPSTFAPASDIPIPADYVIGPGDELVIRGWGQVEISTRATVDRSGQIFLAKVGIISVAGVHYTDLRDHLRAAIQRVFHNFELDVSLGQLRSIQVMVVGQARQPGSYTVSSLSTLVNLLFVCGGPSARGSMRRIQLRRGNQTLTTLDLYELLLNGDKSHDAALLPGDVIYIPPVGPLVALVGSVNLPAIYELSSATTLQQGIDLAGGLTTTADDRKALIERIAEHHVRSVTDVLLDGSQQHFAMMDGDIVRFRAVSPEIENAVTLRGNVARPGRYPWQPGMRVHDLIPSRDFLLTREYWQNKNSLVHGDESVRTLTESVQPPRSQKRSTDEPEGSKLEATKDASTFRTEIKSNAPGLNWDYAAIQRTNPSDLTTELLPFNLARAIASEPESDFELKAGDVVTIFSERDIALANGKQTKLVRLEGEFTAPGVYRCLAGETLRQLVNRIGLASESYLYGAEFTRESTRVQQQQAFDRMISELEKNLVQSQSQHADAEEKVNPEALEARRNLVERLRTLRPTGRIVLALPPSAQGPRELPEVVLEDGDRFVVPHQPATVVVVGEAFNPGAFLHNSKLRVHDYLRDAGGPTRLADASRIFVLRADGTVVSRQSISGVRKANFNHLRLYPGDTIILPPRLERGAFVRGLRDWSQLVSNFVLGAAAVKVLQ